MNRQTAESDSNPQPLPRRLKELEQESHALEEASRDLKQRIEEQRRKSAMPLNASLGDPAIDARNADGRNDLPADADED
jgi:hypothetical protein